MALSHGSSGRAGDQAPRCAASDQDQEPKGSRKCERSRADLTSRAAHLYRLTPEHGVIREISPQNPT